METSLMRTLYLVATLLLLQSAVSADSYKTVAKLHTTFLVSPCELSIVLPLTGLILEPLEGQERLLVKKGNMTKTINQLTDLNGFVAIDSTAKALDYARLRSSPSTWYLWKGSNQAEILSQSQAKRLPNYGLRSYASPTDSSGYFGILSEPAYRKLHVPAVSVEQRNSEFIIKRWLLTKKADKYILQFVTEDVSATGLYHRQIVEERPAPKSPHMLWGFFVFQ